MTSCCHISKLIIFWKIMFLEEALLFDDNVPKSYVQPQVKIPHMNEDGYVLYYTHQCPFTAKYVSIVEEALSVKKFLSLCSK